MTRRTRRRRRRATRRRRRDRSRNSSPQPRRRRAARAPVVARVGPRRSESIRQDRVTSAGGAHREQDLPAIGRRRRRDRAAAGRRAAPRAVTAIFTTSAPATAASRGTARPGRPARREVVRSTGSGARRRSGDPGRRIARGPLDVNEVRAGAPRLLEQPQPLLLAAAEVPAFPGRPAGHDDASGPPGSAPATSGSATVSSRSSTRSACASARTAAVAQLGERLGANDDAEIGHKMKKPRPPVR